MEGATFTDLLARATYLVGCKNCGKYKIIDSLPQELQRSSRETIRKLCYLTRQKSDALSGNDDVLLIHDELLERVKDDVVLPSVAEQADIFMLELAKYAEREGTGVFQEPAPDERRAKLGVLKGKDVNFIINSLCDTGLLERQPNSTGIRLSFAGWSRIPEIKRGHVTATTAFMAMKFNEEELDHLYQEIYKPACDACGYNLATVVEAPKAGLIDEHIMVSIRNSRFVVADVTYSNPGVLWEAGFAEGLGKPVIYSCKKTPDERPHFDIRNRQTVFWEPDKLVDAHNQLATCIRATLPLEAKMG